MSKIIANGPLNLIVSKVTVLQAKSLAQNYLKPPKESYSKELGVKKDRKCFI